MERTILPPDEQNWQGRAMQVARGIRRRVFDHTIRNNGGYLSQACSSAELIATLYTRVMRLGESQAAWIPSAFAGTPSRLNPQAFTGAAYNGPQAPDLDRFFFSPSHYALVLYSALIELGRMGEEGLQQFNQDGSTVEMIGAEHSPGMEVTAGSLGQALSQASGVAMARKIRGDSGRVWVFMSDGEFQEGQTWEAFEVLAHYRLDNIAVFVDVNMQQCDGCMQDVLDGGPLAPRLSAFGAQVFRVDGHNVNDIAQPAKAPREGKPLVVLAYTNPCQGIALLEERRPKLHYVRFKDEAERQRYAAYFRREWAD